MEPEASTAAARAPASGPCPQGHDFFFSDKYEYRESIFSDGPVEPLLLPPTQGKSGDADAAKPACCLGMRLAAMALACGLAAGLHRRPPGHPQHQPPTPSAPTLLAAPASISSGEPVRVSWSGITPQDEDYIIGVYERPNASSFDFYRSVLHDGPSQPSAHLTPPRKPPLPLLAAGSLRDPAAG